MSPLAVPASVDFSPKASRASLQVDAEINEVAKTDIDFPIIRTRRETA